MLSWSAQHLQQPVDLRSVTDPRVDPLLAGGRELVAFVDAALSGHPETGRDGVEKALGKPALVRAAAVIGNFQMMNRVADATGMPVGTGSRRANAELIAELGLDRFDHLEAE